MEATFQFRSPRNQQVSALQWLATWSLRFDTEKFPEEVYRELLDKGLALIDADIEILGAWKDGACRTQPTFCSTDGRLFGKSMVYFTGVWSPTAASCAYTVWQRLPQYRSMLQECLDQGDYQRFLDHLSGLQYTKAGRGGMTNATFGFPRASYVLHVFSQGEFPIYDSNTHSGIYLLTGGRYKGQPITKTKAKDSRWYLMTFCKIIRELQTACSANDLHTQRALDKALFCYGKNA